MIFKKLVMAVAFTGVVLPFFNSCASSDAMNRESNVIEQLMIENPDLQLKDYLRRISGLRVTDMGGQVKVVVSGSTTISGDNSPLYIVNDTPIGTSYEQVENAINIKDIDNIRVLRSSEAMTTYGMQASHGAILIYTRK